MRNDPTQTKACASLIIAIATMLAAAACGPKAPYTPMQVLRNWRGPARPSTKQPDSR